MSDGKVVLILFLPPSNDYCTLFDFFDPITDTMFPSPSSHHQHFHLIGCASNAFPSSRGAADVGDPNGMMAVSDRLGNGRRALTIASPIRDPE
jgi:hypothetical protein